MTTYIVLLRGINVGGKNSIKMADLKLGFEEMGFSDIVTYIQSGNVIFKSDEADKEKLTKHVETALEERYKLDLKVVIVSKSDLQKVIEKSPKGFGTEPEKYRYDVIFVKAPLTAAEAMKQISLKDGVDEASAGPGVLYFSRLTSKVTQSRLSRIIALPMYKNMTIRNWNTTTKLLALCD